MLVKYDSEWLGWKQNYDFLSLPTKQEEYNLIVIEDRFVCLFVTDTIQYQGGLWSRVLGQAPLLLFPHELYSS